jgi:hypothetical protein
MRDDHEYAPRSAVTNLPAEVRTLRLRPVRICGGTRASCALKVVTSW